jgi:ubiquinone/menaquinone biosynthesis C-methylase UbiE
LGQKDTPAEQFFARHAEGYSKSKSHAHGADLAALIEGLRLKKTDVALDAATGTGFTAVSMARLVSHVTGIDVTSEMLEQARLLARKEGIQNAEFELGDALGTKFGDSSFDVVTTRRAAHHFKDVHKFLSEAKRILRPSGRLGVVDMSPPEGTEAFSNEIEKLRDSSHAEAFTAGAWKSMLSEAGFRVVFSGVLEEPVTFEGWLYPVEAGGKEEESVRRAWTTAPSNVKLLLRASFEDGTIRGWTKSRVVLVASKTP